MPDRLATLLAITRHHGAPDELARNLAASDPTDPVFTYPYVFGEVSKRVAHFGMVVADEPALVRALWRASK